MKRVPPKTKKKKAKKHAAIRKLRGKYKHLDLMNALMESARARATIDVEAGALAS